MISCPKCSAEVAENSAFCEKCGEQLAEGAERKEAQPQKRLGNLAAEQHKKHIKSARTAIMAVAILTFIWSVAIYYIGQSGIEAEIAKVKNTPGMVVNEDGVNQARNSIRTLVLINALLSLVYLGLFFWAKKNPLGGSLTALIIYLTIILINAGFDPNSLSQGIIIKIIIIVALISGVKSGLAFKKLQEKSGAA